MLEPSDDLVEPVFVVDHLDGEFLDGLVEVFFTDGLKDVAAFGQEQIGQDHGGALIAVVEAVSCCDRLRDGTSMTTFTTFDWITAAIFVLLQVVVLVSQPGAALPARDRRARSAIASSGLRLHYRNTPIGACRRTTTTSSPSSPRACISGLSGIGFMSIVRVAGVASSAANRHARRRVRIAIVDRQM